MQIALLEHTWEFSNKTGSYDDLFEQINLLLQSTQSVLSHMVIDGVIINDDFEDYIKEHTDTIKQIIIEVHSNRQTLENLLIDTQQYITRSLPLLKEISQDFYSVQTDRTWAQFADMLEGLEWITKVTNLISRASTPFKNTNDYEQLLTLFQGQIVQLDDALREKDFTAIADIINYEINASLESLSQAIQKTIDHEVVRHDIN